MQVLARAQELEDEGHRIVHLEVGEPDFATAPPIVQAGQAALAQGQTKYTVATGIPPLRDAIAAHYAEFGVQVAPERIIVTAGASGGLALLSALLLNPEDELLITDPGYPCNEVFTRLVGARPVRVPVNANQGFQPSAADIQAQFSDTTRGVLLASPANPTGTLLSAEALGEIAATVRAAGKFLILDEIYQGITWNEGYRTGLAVADDIYVLNSFSKFFGMTGWRLGWVVVPPGAIEPMTKLAQNLFISPSTIAQYAALAGFSADAMSIHEARAEEFAQRCEVLSEGLRAMGFHIPVQPQGAFYLYVDVSHTNLDSRTFCWRLLDEFKVATTPGEDFGEHMSDRYVRMAFTTDMASIRLGLERIEQALDSWGVKRV